MKNSEEYIQIAMVIGRMPPYYRVAEAIWGCGVDFDSDGDSSTPEDTNWRELTITLRPGYEQRLDIDPSEHDRDRLVLRATSREVLEEACGFLESVGAIQRIED